MKHINFERVIATDIPKLAELEQDCFSVSWSEKMLMAECESGDCLFIKAIIDSFIVGYVLYKHSAYEADLLRIAVVKKLQKQGIAKAIMQNSLKNEEIKFKDIFLEVRESNIAARKLYESCNFQGIAIRKNYYEKPVEDAVIYKLERKNGE